MKVLPNPSRATLGSWLLAVLCSKVGVRALHGDCSTGLWRAGRTALWGLPACLASLGGLSVSLSTAGLGWLQARMTDEKDVFRKAADLT